MDQIKAMVPQIKKYSFWGMCVGIVAVSVVSWWMSTASLKEDQTRQLTEIETNFSALDNIRSQNKLHPNAATNQGMQQLLGTYSQRVAEGWELQYKNQATVLVWPATFDAEFHAAVEKLRPIEIIPPPPTPFANDLPNAIRQMYRNYIEEDLPVLAQTIGTEWKAVSKAVGTGGDQGMIGDTGSAAAMPSNFGFDGTDSTAKEDKSIVLWDQASQQEIMDTHFGFTGRVEPPSTLEVLYAQEDLWVLQNIMDIIKATNADADARYAAAIKEIHFIRVGRSALGLAGQITAVGPSSQGSGGGVEDTMAGPAPGMGDTGDTAPAMPGMGDGGQTGMPASGTTGGDSSLAAAMSRDPAEGRYVDDKYQPLSAAKLRGALTSRNPDDALLAVAKRMPVRLRFKIDQRRLPRLLAEAGNSRLPVEVRQVRINRTPAAASAANSYGGGGGMGGGAMAMPGAAGYGNESYSGGVAGGMGLMGGGGRGPGSAISDATVDPNLVDVELYGIVYIYNPINHSQLGLTGASATAMTPSTPPAPSPATPGTPSAATSPPAASGVSLPSATVPVVGS